MTRTCHRCGEPAPCRRDIGRSFAANQHATSGRMRAHSCCALRLVDDRPRGRTVVEAAIVLDLDPATIKRAMARARAAIAAELATASFEDLPEAHVHRALAKTDPLAEIVFRVIAGLPLEHETSWSEAA